MRIAAVLTLATAAIVSAQGFGRSWGACRTNWDADEYYVSPFFAGNPTYDGRVTFARIKYKGGYECEREGPGWAHDYPRTESHFVRILREITTVEPFVEDGPITGSAVIRLDDPALSYCPIACMSEPGGWTMSDAEVTGLRNFIQRGGFTIFDDIEGRRARTTRTWSCSGAEHSRTRLRCDSGTSIQTVARLGRGHAGYAHLLSVVRIRTNS